MARPRKRIALFSSNEVDLNTWEYPLWVRGWGVTRLKTKEAATDLIQSVDPPRVIVIIYQSYQTTLLLCDMASRVGVGTIVLRPARCAHAMELCADRVCVLGRETMADVLENIKVLADRKRGPKPIPAAQEKVAVM